MPAGGAPEGVAANPEETYKQIADPDDFKRPPNSNMVKVDGEKAPDGAAEKMLSEDDKKLADVKFVKDQKNGDTKVDILEIKQAFVGLTKEELMKYCNDPFWVRLRWFMFVLFWTLWLGMLLGAIYIIVQAPKCAPPPPKTWWEEGPMIDLDDPDTTASEESLADFKPKLSALSSFKGLLIPERYVAPKSAYDLLDGEKLQVFKDFAQEAKDKDIRLIIDLTPNYVDKTNEWFKKSEANEEEFKDYFIWQNATDDENGNKKPVNNWISIANEPSWTYSPVRRQSYLHQFGTNKPDLNFRNQNVVKEFVKVIKFWLENGVSGIRLNNAKHLLVNPSFRDEKIDGDGNGADHGQYRYWRHDETAYQKDLDALLRGFKEEVDKLTDNTGFFGLNEDVPKTPEARGLMKDQIFTVSVGRFPDVSKKRDESLAKKLRDYIESVFRHLGAEAWPIWEYPNADVGQLSEYRIIMSLLPGVPAFTARQVLKSSTEVDPGFVGVTKLRNLDSVMYGSLNTTLLESSNVFGFTRLKSGNPGLAVLYNPGDKLALANATTMHKMPTEVTVNYLSDNYKESNVTLKSKVPSDRIPISAKSVIVLSYVQGE